MATNKFATMLHRNTNKFVVILVYAVLEWVLIVLLLLNSLFSYFITKFAKWVGLQRPCPWCSRVDHILEPVGGTNSHRDLVCETHAVEISKLGYCSNHRKLAETQRMCEDCLVSRPNHDEDSVGMTRRIAFISWVSHNIVESDENMKRCSCCNESFSSRFYPPYLLSNPSWGDENYTSKGTLIVEAIDDDDDEKKEGDKDTELERHSSGEEHDDEGGADEHQILSDIESFILREVAEDRSSSVSNLHTDEKDAEKDEKEDNLTITGLDPINTVNLIRQFSDTSMIQASFVEDRSLEVINMHFEKHVACETDRLIPVELIDSFNSANFDQSCNLKDDQRIESFAGDPPNEAQSSILEEAALNTMDENAEQTSMGELQSMDSSMTSLKNYTVLELEELKQESVVEVHSRSLSNEAVQTSSNDSNNVEAAKEGPDNLQANLSQSEEPACSNEFTQEDESSTSDDDTEVQGAFDEFIAQNNLCKSETLSSNGNIVEAAIEKSEDTQAHLPRSQEPCFSSQCIEEDQSSTSDDDTEPNGFDKFTTQNDLCQVKTGRNDNEYADMVEKTTLVEKNNGETSNQSSKCSEANDVEEDKLPETPSSVDGLHYLHRKLMLFEKRESGVDESVDDSVASEAECGDPVSTIERLKTALKAERKALSALYQELEEERSASAIAANQTMAMITRLQEEKAAMQMEALQYQRMMEEQSEYDQEALQLLNELMVKREKEKQELEKELEDYRQKFMDYEAKEKLRVLRTIKNGSVRGRESSPSCSIVGDTDELSIDLNREARDEDNGVFNYQENSHNNTTGDTVSNLEEMALDCVNHISALDNSLSEYEEERISILDQLKALEERIITLGGNDQFLDDIKLNENSSTYDEKDLNENGDFSILEDKYSNGFPDHKHSSRRTMGSLAKRLLPYLDAADNETEEAYTFETQFEPQSVNIQNSVPTQEMDSRKVSIEEEVDHVYERLQALQTDKEFLKHCMGSLQNGDKGMDLLQEILLYLRDLKAVELRLKSLGDDPLG